MEGTTTPANRALAHLIARITNKTIATDTLENELKTIISERDEITFDRFDKIAEEANVVDLENERDLSVVFERVAEELAKDFDCSKEYIHKLLCQREKDGSTVITPFVAIPHIIIEGEKKFHMVIVRSKKGIKFSREYKHVKAIFVLAGTKDERNFHLRALAAIANVISNPEFRERWLDAKNENLLKHVIVLSKRIRE